MRTAGDRRPGARWSACGTGFPATFAVDSAPGRDGELIESSGNVLAEAAGHTFDFLVRDPAASQALDTGIYTYVVKIGGQPVLSAVCSIR